MMKIGEALNWARETLSGAEIEEAGIESEVMLQEELHLSRVEIYLNFHKVIPLNLNSLKNKIIERAKRIPLAYILGKTQFMGLDFFVDERVMIPRQETEVLVESVLDCVNGLMNQETTGRASSATTMVDIGTGCGNIAISLAKSIPCSRIYATDISGEAIELARKNSRRNGIPEERISFFQGDLFKPLNDLEFFKKVDIIVSNPPYIPSPEIKNLQKEVRFEPRIALDGGFDGLELYRRIISEAPLYLKDGGCLFMEIGFGQAKEVKDLISKNSNFLQPCVINDYSGIGRVVRARTKR